MGKKYVMSSNQKRIYAMESAQKLNTAYNMPILIKVQTKINTERFKNAVENLIMRHEVLRTHFDIKGENFIQEVEEKFTINVLDIKCSNLNEVVKKFREFVCPFNLEKDLLFRAILFNTEENITYMGLDMHHIVTDGQSAIIIWNDLFALYQGLDLEQMDFQYKDYSAWIEEMDFTKHQEYWKGEFAGEIPLLDMQTDRVRGNEQSFEGDVVLSTLDKDIVQKVKILAKETETTEFVVMLTFFSILLSKYARQKELIIGMPVAGRTIKELEKIVGMFVNTIAIKVEVLEEYNIYELIEYVKRKCYQAYEYQDYPFDKLIDDLKLRPDNSRNPLFDVMFAQEENSNKLLWGEAEATVINTEVVSAKFDLSVTVTSEGENSIVGWEYRTALFNKSSVERMAQHYINLIRDAIQNRDKKITDLSVIDEEEYKQVVNTFNNTKISYPQNKTIIEVFEEQVIKTPNHIAVQLREEKITYGHLNARANYLGEKLRENGIKENDVVGLITERSIEMIIGIYGILKAGAAYMPIDASHPADRVKYMLSEVKTKVIVLGKGSEKLSNEIDECKKISLYQCNGLVEENLKHFSNPESIAYIIFTSGSTGKPKGVMVKNKGVVNVSFWQILNGEMDSDTNVIQNFNYIFDASVSEIFPTGFAGAKLILLPEERKNDPELFLKLLPESQLCVVPSMFRMILEYANIHNKLEVFNKFDKIYLAAEALPRELLQRYQELTGNTFDKLFNIYGPTETTDSAVSYKFEGYKLPDTIPIGKPISNTRTYILNGRQLCGIGMPGELCIAGEGMSLGYLNRPELTSEKFIENPIVNGEIIYKTGDLVRWLEDGNIDYIGRIDDQVKIRGFRIELGEIESRLREFDEIYDSTVISKIVNGDKVLCAYLISKDIVNFRELRKKLMLHLPEYMIPSYFTVMEEFPKTNSGKLDRKALPEPTEDVEENSYIEPVTTNEKLLSDIIKSILQVEKFGRNDNFIEKGGDSIKAIRIMSKVREAELEINVKDIMKYKTLSEIAIHLQEKIIYVNQDAVEGEFELSPIQAEFIDKVKQKNHFNQTVIVKCGNKINTIWLEKVLNELVRHHDMLRSTYKLGKQVIKGVEESDLFKFYIIKVKDTDDIETIIKTKGAEIQTDFNIDKGPLFSAVLFDTKVDDYIMLCAHHFVVDAVSWQIIIEDIEKGYKQLESGKNIRLPNKTVSYKEWVEKQINYTHSSMAKKEYDYWKDQEEELKNGGFTHEISEKVEKIENKVEEITLDETETEDLKMKVTSYFHMDFEEVLIASVIDGMHSLTGQTQILLNVEHHGRDSLLSEIALDRTVGWFTALFPLGLVVGNDIKENFISVKEKIRRIPNKGIGYGALKAYKDLQLDIPNDVTFNFLGEVFSSNNKSGFNIVDMEHGKDMDDKEDKWNKLSIDAYLDSGKLVVNLTYNNGHYTDKYIKSLGTKIKNSISNVIAHCNNDLFYRMTPSDVSELEWNKEEFSETVKKIQTRGGEINKIIPLSHMQQGMLFHKVIDDKSTEYVVQSLYDTQLTDSKILQKTIKVLLEKHPILQSCIIYKDVRHPRQVLTKGINATCEVLDFSGIKFSGTTLQKYLKEDLKKGFNLEKELIRFALIKLEHNKYKFLITFHHILMDGWCTSILVEEINNIYSLLASGKPTKELVGEVDNVFAQYTNIVQKRDNIADLLYWEELLKGYETETEDILRKGNNDISIETNKEIMVLEKKIGGNTTKKLVDLAKKYSITPNTIVEAAWGILLQKYTNSSDVVFGKVVSGRNLDIRGIDRAIGLFINTIPVRVNSYKKSTMELLLDLQEQALDSEEHDQCSLAEVQGKSEFGNRLINSVLAFENFYQEEESVATNLTLEEGREQTNYDLSLAACLTDELLLGVMYKTNKYNDEDCRWILNHLSTIIYQVVETPERDIDRISMVSKNEEKLILHNFNNNCRQYEKQSILDRFVQQVISYRDKTAVRCGEIELSYSELDNKSNCVANKLISEGAEDGNIVPILMDRNEKLIIGILGILKAGCAYLPIDKNYPIDRIKYMIKDSNSQLLLTDQSKEKYGINAINIADISTKDISLDKNIDANSLAYVIYTSGTTGVPKGVLIEHQNIMNTINWVIDYFEFDCNTKVSQNFNYIFDGSVWEIFPGLLSGGILEINSNGYRDNYDNILEQIDQKVVTMVPSVFRPLLDYAIKNNKEEDINKFDKLFLAAESLPAELIERYKSTKHCHVEDVFNCYGPTETSVCATYFPCEEYTGAEMTIGKPIANTKVYILNENELCGIGVPGELCITGNGVARGYLNQEQLSQEKFVTIPSLSRETIYRTGDLAKWQEKGNIVCLGRIDEQVKIRGYRVELMEIEEKLREIKGIDEALVDMKICNEELVLCAFLVGTEEISSQLLKKKLERKLPEYMIPTRFLFIEEIPRTTSGKLDKKNLPIPEIINTTQTIQEQLSESEEQLLKAIKETLHEKEINKENSFFEVGGDSIKAIKLASLLKERNILLEVKDVICNIPIRELALRMRKSMEKNSIKKVIACTEYQEYLNMEGKFIFDSKLLKCKEKIDRNTIRRVFEKLILKEFNLTLKFSTMEFNESKDALWEFQELTFRDSKEVKNYFATKEKTLCDLKKRSQVAELVLCKTTNEDFLILSLNRIFNDSSSLRIFLSKLEKEYKNNNKIFSFNDSGNEFKKWLSERKVKEICKYNSQDVNLNYRTILNKETTEKLLCLGTLLQGGDINEVLIGLISFCYSKVSSCREIGLLIKYSGRYTPHLYPEFADALGCFTEIQPLYLEAGNSTLSTIQGLIENGNKINNSCEKSGILYKYFETEEYITENHMFEIKQKISFAEPQLAPIQIVPILAHGKVIVSYNYNEKYKSLVMQLKNMLETEIEKIVLCSEFANIKVAEKNEFRKNLIMKNNCQSILQEVCVGKEILRVLYVDQKAESAIAECGEDIKKSKIDFVLTIDALKYIKKYWSSDEFKNYCSKFILGHYKKEEDKEFYTGFPISGLQKEYEPSDIQKYLLDFPYSITQDQIEVFDFSEEYLEKKLKQFIIQQESMRTSYCIKNKKHIMQVSSAEDTILITKIDLCYMNAEQYRNIYHNIYDVERIKNVFGENLKLLYLIMTKESERKFVIHITANHTVWDKKSTDILKEYIKGKEIKSVTPYSQYAEISNQSLKINLKEELDLFLGTCAEYCNRNVNRFVVCSEYLEINLNDVQEAEFERNPWKILSCVVEGVLKANGLIEQNNYDSIYLITQEDRGCFQGEFLNTTGVFIDMLPIISSRKIDMSNEVSRLVALKEKYNVKFLEYLYKKTKLPESILSFNFIGDYSEDLVRADELMNTDFVEASQEIVVFRCKNKLAIRYPIFDEVQHIHNKTIIDIINEVIEK